MMSKEIKFNFEDIIIQDKEGNQIDLSKVKTLEDLKNAIIYEIEFPYCKNCGFYSMCLYKRNTSEGTCAFLDEVIRRYIDMNIKSIDYKNSYFMEEFIKSCYYFAHMSKDFLDLIGIYTDNYFNSNLESMHTNMNSLFSHKILINLSKYLDSIRKIDFKKIKKFIILVEGESDKIILSSILNSLGVLGIHFDIKNSVRFYVLEGKDRLKKKDSIKDYFKRFRETETEYFLFLDKDSEEDVNDLIREGIVNQSYIFYFERELEEEYPIKKLVKAIEEIKPDLKGIFKERIILTKLKEKKLKEILSGEAYNQSKSFNLDDIKVELSKRISKETSEELEKSIIVGGVHMGNLKPKSKTYKKLVEKIRPLAEKINKLSTDYYIVKKVKKN